MKKYFLLTLLTAVLSPLFTQAQSVFTINGKISGKGHPQKAYLLYRLYQQDKQLLDSSDIKNGQFGFKGTVSDPVLATIKIRYQSDTGSPISEPDRAALERGELTCSTCLNDKLVFMLAGGRTSFVSADSLKHTTISGPKASMDYSELNAALLPVKSDWLHLRKDDYEAKQLPRGSKRTSTIANIADSMVNVLRKWGMAEDKFAQSHTDSYAGLWAFSDLMNNGLLEYKLEAPEKYFEKFSPEIRATQRGKDLAEKFHAPELTGFGKKFVDFTQPDINGKPFSLSSLKGKYVLIDFWASWCHPCRAEIPNLMKAYGTLKGKNLEIVGVSLDQDGAAWREAVQKEGMTWIQVSDLKGGNNALAKKLGVTGIPQNYLIDPNGVIIGREIRGEDTEKQLARLMKVE